MGSSGQKWWSDREYRHLGKNIKFPRSGIGKNLSIDMEFKSVASCQEPAWGTPPMAKVMRKEASAYAKADRASGNPLFPSIYPQNQSLPTLLFYALTYTSDFMGGWPPLPLSEKELTYSSKSIKISGRDRSVSTYELHWRLSSLPYKFVWPHVIVYSLPTVRGMRCFRLTKGRLFWEVRNYWYSGLVRNYIGEGFFHLLCQ